MTNSQRLAIVRAHLTRWLNQQYESEDAPQAAVQLLGESILIVDGYYGGRTFRARVGESLLTATWFMEPDELKIRSSDGEVLASFQGEEMKDLPVVAAETENANERPKTTVDQPVESPCRELICLPIPRPDQVDFEERKAA
ncbi:MAG: hypothetical protein AAF802_26705 [Planctomycetota bacterium]